MAVKGLPVVVCVGGRGVEGGARQKGYDGVAEEPGGVGLEFLFERVEDGLLVTFLAEHTVECRESLGASADAAAGAAAGVSADTADAGMEHG